MVKFTLFFLSLSFLIILHEFGHFITARWFKMRVDKFYLFFDFLFPFGNIMKFSLFKKKVKGTEYGLGWFPFGGYVDIAGMMADPDKPDTPPEPDEFRAKRPYQRLIVLAGGVIVNFLLGIIIYSMMFFAWGEDYVRPQDAKYGVAVDSILVDAGMSDGDIIVAIDGEPVERMSQIATQIIIDEARTVDVMRNGQKQTINLPEGLDDKFVAADAKYAVEARVPFVIDSVNPESPASKAGFKKGDSLITLGQDTLLYHQQFVKSLQHFKSKEVNIGFYRDGQWMELKVTPNEMAQLGVFGKSPTEYLAITHKDYGFFQSWGRGWSRTLEQLGNYVKQMRFIFTKEGASKVGGFASIASVFPDHWDWQAFWGITAMLSIILAFMNLLPIPVLDGGYILFVLWEMITGKKVSDKFMSKALAIGMYLVLGLLILANGNDLYRFITK